MENFIKQLVPKKMNDYRLKTNDFIDLYNDGEVEIVDIRMDFEVKVWQLNFGLQVPANELPDNLDKLPKDKIIVCACPKCDRSIMACSYLNSIGIKSCYLADGLMDLMQTLKGGMAKSIDLDSK
jgi:rhodanese-related sulfurtransferase